MIKFKIEMDLQIKDQLIGCYAYMRCMSNNNICNASREKIAERLQIKRVKTISEYSGELERLNLITKKRYYNDYNNQICEYHISNVENDFIVLTSNLFNYGLNASEIGFFIKLATLREKFTNKIEITKSAICRKFDCKLETLNKKLNKFVEVGIISLMDGIILNDEVVPVIKPSVKLSNENKALLVDILSNKKKYPIKIYNQIKDYCEKKLYFYLDADKMFDNIIAGLVKNRPNKGQIKDMNINTQFEF